MSAIILTDPQGSDAWLESRRSRVGASEIGALACLSPFAGPADVWARKVGAIERRSNRDLHKRIGHLLEGLSRELWTEYTGVESGAGPVIADGLLLASLDHWSATREPVDGKVVTGGNPDRALFTEVTIPEAIALQITQQAHLVERLTGSRIDVGHAAVITVGHFGFEFRPYRVPMTAERRELYAELAYDQLPKWWDHYVVGRRPPPDATIHQVAAAVDLAKIVKRAATDEEARLLAAWAAEEARVKDAAKALREAEAARDVPKTALAVSLGCHEAVPGVRWQPIKGQKPRFVLEKE